MADGMCLVQSVESQSCAVASGFCAVSVRDRTLGHSTEELVQCCVPGGLEGRLSRVPAGRCRAAEFEWRDLCCPHCTVGHAAGGRRGLGWAACGAGQRPKSCKHKQHATAFLCRLAVAIAHAVLHSLRPCECMCIGCTHCDGCHQVTRASDTPRTLPLPLLPRLLRQATASAPDPNAPTVIGKGNAGTYRVSYGR